MLSLVVSKKIMASHIGEGRGTRPMLVAEEKLKNARLAMVTATKLVLMNVLDTLGIVAPEEL
ncbi:MAG: hypothetical protein KJ773_09600 [Candidatus Thermoplasmatota archaeon]|nr:hypothetical protein [Candidatus Thermoplasmatota archaeon]